MLGKSSRKRNFMDIWTEYYGKKSILLWNLFFMEIFPNFHRILFPWKYFTSWFWPGFHGKMLPWEFGQIITVYTV